MKNLDTITDFVKYLERKEKLVKRPNLRVMASGEEDLLALYLRNLNENDEHDFIIPENIEGIDLEEGYWEKFSNSGEYIRQQKADEISYGWDRLIEFTTMHFTRQTLYFSTDLSFKSFETNLGF